MFLFRGQSQGFSTGVGWRWQSGGTPSCWREGCSAAWGGTASASSWLCPAWSSRPAGYSGGRAAWTRTCATCWSGRVETLPESFECSQPSVCPQLSQFVEGEIQPGHVGHPQCESVLLQAGQDLNQSGQGGDRAVGQANIQSIATIVTDMQKIIE